MRLPPGACFSWWTSAWPSSLLHQFRVYTI